MKKFVAVMVVLMISATLFGCGGQPEKSEPKSTEPASAAPQQAKPEELKVIESGWSAGTSGFIHYGIGIENPNTSFEADFPTINVIGKDAAGKVLFSDKQVLGFMLPGAKYYYGGQAGKGTVPATVEFSVSVGDRNWKPNDKQSMAIYTISNPSEVVGQFGDVSYTGEITANEEWKDVGRAMVNAILRDGSGKIVAGYFGFADVSKKGDTAAFDISAYDVPEHASYEIYAQPWF